MIPAPSIIRAGRAPDATPKGTHAYHGEDPELERQPTPDVIETDNPIVATLLGPDGSTIRQWRERPPFGYRR